jgi:hypothetical protein
VMGTDDEPYSLMYLLSLMQNTVVQAPIHHWNRPTNRHLPFGTVVTHCHTHNTGKRSRMLSARKQVRHRRTYIRSSASGRVVIWVVTCVSKGKAKETEERGVIRRRYKETQSERRDRGRQSAVHVRGVGEGEGDRVPPAVYGVAAAPVPNTSAARQPTDRLRRSLLLRSPVATRTLPCHTPHSRHVLRAANSPVIAAGFTLANAFT